MRPIRTRPCPPRARQLVAHGDSRSLTGQPAMHLTCTAAGPPGAPTSFASRGSGWNPRALNGSAEQVLLHPLEEAGSKSRSVAGAVQHVPAGDLSPGEFPVHVTRLGSISAHADGVVDLGKDCPDVVGQRAGAVRVWLADRPVSRIDCPCRGREVGLVSRWCRSRSRREARASVVRHAGAGRRRAGSGRARRDLRRRDGE